MDAFSAFQAVVSVFEFTTTFLVSPASTSENDDLQLTT